MTHVPKQSPPGKSVHPLVLPTLALLVIAAAVGFAFLGRPGVRLAQNGETTPPPPSYAQALARAEAAISDSTAPAKGQASDALRKTPDASPSAAPVSHLRARRPVVLAWMKPAYPRLALANHIEGDVDVAVRIDKRGLPEVLSATGGNATLQQAALEAAQQWRFKPAGAPQDYLIHFTFKLA